MVDGRAKDTDPDGDRPRVETFSAAAHGTAHIAVDGRVSYTPAANYHRADRFLRRTRTISIARSTVRLASSSGALAKYLSTLQGTAHIAR